jgi:hypothetical protein
VYFQVKNTYPHNNYKEFARGLMRWTCHQIEHSAAAFGLPRVPKEAYAPRIAYGQGAQKLTRVSIAKLYINIILDKAMVEIQDCVLKKIKKEGVFSLYQLMEEQSLLKSMTEFIAANDIGDQTVSPEQPDS